MWEFLYNILRGLIGTFIFAMFLDWLGRKRKIDWISSRSKREIVAFVWALEVLGALMFYVLISTSSLLLFAFMWALGMWGTFFIFNKWGINVEDQVTFPQIIFCIVWIPMLGAIVFFLSIFVHLWWLF